jgi:CDP-diacylglycerol--glycerol-3-phosphate 3-phosphatidyltransferase
MPNLPNLLTLLRLALIPLLILLYYLKYPWAPAATTGVFTLAALTDLLDGYLARKLDQESPMGAFLDPVADKLIVAVALVVLAADPAVQRMVWDQRVFAVVVVIIIGREITVSALREWMAEVGKRSRVAVSYLGKVKTVFQLVAIGMMLYRAPVWGIPIPQLGEGLLYLAAGLTLWSMMAYLRAAWPSLRDS